MKIDIDKIIILLLSFFILYINENRIIFKDLFNNHITKIIILFFISFNFTNKPQICLLVLINYILILYYINKKLINKFN